MKNIIDIRSKNKYSMGHIPSAINIEYLELLSNPSKYLNKNEIYYLYCDSGYTSSMVVNKLNNIGYNTVNIDGGYNNYLLRK
ncbi:MAG: rhodanese-like domain-containing protein [Bacilli bacterium]|nr:rhodanese-like domain-containing protein [Bacilli bacterium]